MTSEAILSAVGRYESILCTYMPERQDAEAICPSREQAMCHISWMCGQVHEFVAAGKLDKASRWICFIQGTLWTLGHGSINEFREDNLAGSEQG